MSEETLLNEEVATEETAEAPVETEGWFLSEGVNGEGEQPEWFKSSKYKTVADQAQAYAGLESKLGSFTGAPENGYEVVIPEGMNVSIPDDDPMLSQFNEWAAKSGLSQDAHTELLGVYIENVLGSMPNIEDEVKRIGPDAQERISSMVSWGKANLDQKDFETMQSLATTAEGFQLLEKMRSMSRESQVSAPDQVKPTSSMSKEKLYEMIADERYETSSSYRAEVEQRFKDFFGTEPAKEIRA